MDGSTATEMVRLLGKICEHLESIALSLQILNSQVREEIDEEKAEKVEKREKRETY